MAKLGLLLLLISYVGHCQEDIIFGSDDQKVNVYRGNNVYIKTDSAIVINQQFARSLNARLQELHTARELMMDQGKANQKLIRSLSEVDGLVAELVNISDINHQKIRQSAKTVLSELDQTIDLLKSNNASLVQNNELLKVQLLEMEDSMKKLRREIRGIWWNGLLDKVVVGIFSLGLGIAVGLAF